MILFIGKCSCSDLLKFFSQKFFIKKISVAIDLPTPSRKMALRYALRTKLFSIEINDAWKCILKNLTTEYSTEMRGNKAQRRSKLQYSLETSLSCPIFSDMKIFFFRLS